MKKSIFSLLAVLVLGPALCSQSLEDVLALNYRGRGGLERLKSLTGWQLTGKIVVPDRMRVESIFQGKKIIQACAGRVAWWIMPFLSPAAQEMPEEQGLLFREQADFANPLVVYKEKGYALQLLGREDLDGKPAFKLKLIRENGREIVIFLDAASGVELKSARRVRIAENDALVEILYGDYRPVSGCLMPFAIENRLDGQTQMRMTFDAIEINPVLEAAFFTMPLEKEALAAGEK
jgi:hypothetical protein